eukprot:2886400-Pyramimonas_sp.AAC.1
MSSGTTPTSADKDFALRSVQAKIDQAIYEEGTKWTPPDAQAGTPADVDGAAEKFDFFNFKQRFCSTVRRMYLDPSIAKRVTGAG